MSPKLKRLSGREVVAILNRFGFEVHTQRGSHIKLRRIAAGQKQTLTVAAHAELDPGTLHAIYRQASRYVPADTLRPHFFAD
ncbi:MAG: type II toxin-antitoxin system HicA family toxin [Dehalococcoidia bacterium]